VKNVLKYLYFVIFHHWVWVIVSFLTVYRHMRVLLLERSVQVCLNSWHCESEKVELERKSLSSTKISV